jgi:hypothetical protein
MAGAEGREKKYTQNVSQEIYYDIPLWISTHKFKNHIKIIDNHVAAFSGKSKW